MGAVCLFVFHMCLLFNISLEASPLKIIGQSQAKFFCNYALENLSTDSYKATTACYEFFCLKSIIHSSLLTEISLKKLIASCQKQPCTMSIKPECLVHLCAEHVFLYTWICYTSWFEPHRSQDEYFSGPFSVYFHLRSPLC